MSQIQDIKERADIVEVIGERISLQRGGKNLRALCPFHSEKSPSFYVSPEMQRFICFGCGKKGDVITFVEEFDRLTFQEALEYLAEKTGIELKKNEFVDPRDQQRKTLFEILDLAQQYYTFLLTQHARGEAARAYLQDRGAQSATLKAFGLGYAPEDWSALTTYLTKKKGFTEDDVIASGLALRGRTGQAYDRFRHRLMFPLQDHRGRVVGFSGRLLDKTTKEAKYINTPETELYHKRHLLFGYWQNLDAIREKESVIVMEGEFDVLSSVQAHVRNVVAVKGSALTEEQIRTLARTVKTIYLALDADSAGTEATKRAIELVQPFPVALRVIPLTGGKDPDEMARQNPGEWREATKQHVSAFEYVLEAVLRENDIQTPDGVRSVTDTMLALLSKVEHHVERAFYLKQLASRINISDSILEEQWQTRQQQQKFGVPAKRGEPEGEKREEEETDTLGRYLLQLALSTATAPPSIHSSWLHEPILQRIWQLYTQWHQEHSPFVLKAFARSLPEELQEIVAQMSLENLPVEEKLIPHELSLITSQLDQRWRKQRLQEVSALVSALEEKDELPPEDEARYQELQKEMLQLTGAQRA